MWSEIFINAPQNVYKQKRNISRMAVKSASKKENQSTYLCCIVYTVLEMLRFCLYYILDSLMLVQSQLSISILEDSIIQILWEVSNVKSL